MQAKLEETDAELAAALVEIERLSAGDAVGCSRHPCRMQLFLQPCLRTCGSLVEG